MTGMRVRGRPSPSQGRTGASWSQGSAWMLTRGSKTCSPSLLPPPFFDRKLRPSSAWRASKKFIMNEIRPAAACGSRITVYLPGSSARALAEALALRIAVRTSRSEEHTSELQSRENLVCRLLLEKKKKNEITIKRPEIPRQHPHV